MFIFYLSFFLMILDLPKMFTENHPSFFSPQDCSMGLRRENLIVSIGGDLLSPYPLSTLDKGRGMVVTWIACGWMFLAQSLRILIPHPFLWKHTHQTFLCDLVTPRNFGPQKKRCRNLTPWDDIWRIFFRDVWKSFELFDFKCLTHLNSWSRKKW